jgi:molybdenum cofactor synthesis domain-containing protein
LIIKSLFRITSHKQLVDVDNVSTSIDKVSKHILILDREMPVGISSFIEDNPIGTLIVVDSFGKSNYNTFDIISGAETHLKIVKQLQIYNVEALLCIPNNFLTFQHNQRLKHIPKVFQVKVVTLSDRAYRGIYKDRSGPLITEMIMEYFKEIEKNVIVKNIIIPDSAENLVEILETAKEEETDVIITTGGTGIGNRDITVETVEKYLDKEIPGIMEMIRVKYGAEKPNALLSRGVAGTMDETLVYTLPGSVKAVKEYLTEIFKTLDHLFYMLHNIDNH